MANLWDILKKFTPYDHDKDGTSEINSLTPLPSPSQQKPLDDGDKLLLIIVNKKVLDKTPKKNAKYLRNDLETLRRDLEQDGYVARSIVADVYSGPNHQDGMTVLAIRNFFQEVRKGYPYFQGAILIGSFPEAFLVRSYPWRKSAGYADKSVTINGIKIEGQDFLEIRPDVIATRSDLVLCDLDGNWDSIYVKNKTTLPSLMAVPESVGSTNWADYGTASVLDRQIGTYDPTKAAFEENFFKISFEDFFHINDGAFMITKTQEPSAAGKKFVTELHISTKRDLEVSSKDLANPNPLATPKIIVSRIDASHVAVVPNPNYPSDKGESLTDPDGKPQQISATAVYWHLLYVHDDGLEIKLLMQYLERNHAYRVGTWVTEPIEYAAIAGPEFHRADLMNQILGPLSYEYSGTVDPPDGAGPAQYVRWLRKRSMIYAITTHANSGWFYFRDFYGEREELFNALGDLIKGLPQGTVYIGPFVSAIKKNEQEIQQEIDFLNTFLGSNPERWYWDSENQKLCPGWRDLKGQASMHIHKALWASGMENSCVGGRFYITEGCDVNSCNIGVPYDDDFYAKEQLAESFLFYVRGLATIARAKTFNDLPPNIGLIFEHQQQRFGEIWRGYFRSEKQDGVLDNVTNGIRRKKAYFWGVVGDWTLKAVGSKFLIKI